MRNYIESWYSSHYRYTNAAAGATMAFASEAAVTLGLNPPSLADWRRKAGAMLIPTAEFCLTWPNASIEGCPKDEIVTIHPQCVFFL